MVICDGAERIGAENCAGVTAGIEQSGNASDVSVFTDAEGNQAGGYVYDTANHQIHHGKEEQRENGIFLRVEQNDQEYGNCRNKEEQAFQEEVAAQTFFHPFDEECASEGNFGEDHCQENGKGFRYGKITLQDGGQPCNNAVSDENGASGTQAGEDEYENEIRGEERNLFGGSIGDGSFFCFGFCFNHCAVMMEGVFRAAYAEEPCKSNGKRKGERKVEYDTPGNAERIQKRGNTVADESTNAVCHAVPDDTAADIFTGKESGLNIQNVAPKHTLRKTVDKPNIFHRFNAWGKSDSEVAERRNDQCKRNGIFRVTVFGDESVDELSCRITEKIKRAYRSRKGLVNTEPIADGDQVCAVAKSANVSGRICQTTEQD